MSSKEQNILNYIEYCEININPVLLTYKENMHISSIIKEWTKKDPIYDFITEDMIKHTVWIIDDEDTINTLIDLFSDIKRVYIADGHHRIAASTKFALKKRKNNFYFDKEDKSNFFLSAIFPANELFIRSYNRVVKDLNGLSSKKFLEMLKEEFYVFPFDSKEPYIPEKKNTFGLYLEKEWYKLITKQSIFDQNNLVDGLDVSILYNNIFHPILGIYDEKNDNRIDFISELKGPKELEKRANSDMKAAFSLYPISLNDVIHIGNIGEILPPKSTYFEPKFRSGLFIYKLK